MKIGILNYDACNIKSVFNTIYRVGHNPIIINKSKDFEQIDKLIIPGVGSAYTSIQFLKKNNLIDEIKNFLLKKKPIMGICLGLQLLCKNLTEGGKCEGFSFIDANVQPLFKNLKANIGWYELFLKEELIKKLNLKKNRNFYFCHSYYLKFNNSLEERNCVGTIIFDQKIPSIVIKENLIGVQFHPEKSQESGEKILNYFINKF